MTDAEWLKPTTCGARGLEPDRLREAQARAFEEAWDDLGTLAADTIAPEATYQAWLAHLVIERLGLLHVVREVDFGVKHLGETAAARFGGSNLMVDLLILREPVVALPRRAALAVKELPDGHPNPKSGLARLRDFTVITELKVSATQSEGLDYGEVVRDFEKLSAILNAAEAQYPTHPLPLAYVGVFNNRKKPRFNFDHLARRLAQVDVRSDVKLLTFDVAQDAQSVRERSTIGDSYRSHLLSVTALRQRALMDEYVAEMTRETTAKHQATLAEARRHLAEAEANPDSPPVVLEAWARFIDRIQDTKP